MKPGGLSRIFSCYTVEIKKEKNGLLFFDPSSFCVGIFCHGYRVMNLIKIMQGLVFLLVLLLVLYGARYWMDKPYCMISIEDPSLAQGRLGLWTYAVSKISPPQKAFTGKKTHLLYIYLDDPRGILSVRCTVNGKAKKLDVPPMVPVFQTEFNGYEDYGTHRYHIEVENGEGQTASAVAVVTLSPPY